MDGAFNNFHGFTKGKSLNKTVYEFKVSFSFSMTLLEN